MELRLDIFLCVLWCVRLQLLVLFLVGWSSGFLKVCVSVVCTCTRNHLVVWCLVTKCQRSALLLVR